MSIVQLSIAKSLAFTQVGSGGPTGPISSIQKYSFSHNKELVEFLMGPARVKGHYQGTSTATISVDTADLGRWVLLKVGQKYDNVILTIDNTFDSDGGAVSSGQEVTVTLSAAVITEVGELSMGNENDSPAVGSVTFTLSRHPEDTSDPTFTIAAV